MEAIITIAIILIGITQMRRLERKVKNQGEKIYLLEQLLEMNLIKDGKEQTEKTEAGKAESKT